MPDCSGTSSEKLGETVKLSSFAEPASNEACSVPLAASSTRGYICPPSGWRMADFCSDQRRGYTEKTAGLKRLRRRVDVDVDGFEKEIAAGANLEPAAKASRNVERAGQRIGARRSGELNIVGRIQSRIERAGETVESRQRGYAAVEVPGSAERKGGGCHSSPKSSFDKSDLRKPRFRAAVLQPVHLEHRLRTKGRQWTKASCQSRLQSQRE